MSMSFSPYLRLLLLVLAVVHVRSQVDLCVSRDVETETPSLQVRKWVHELIVGGENCNAEDVEYTLEASTECGMQDRFDTDFATGQDQPGSSLWTVSLFLEETEDNSAIRSEDCVITLTGTSVTSSSTVTLNVTIQPLPTAEPTAAPTPVATAVPSPTPTSIPTASPTPLPTHEPTSSPTANPTKAPTLVPTPIATNVPTLAPTPVATNVPTPVSTNVPTPISTNVPTPEATNMPTSMPTSMPTPMPTGAPIPTPTSVPTPMSTASVGIADVTVSGDVGIFERRDWAFWLIVGAAACVVLALIIVASYCCYKRCWKMHKRSFAPSRGATVRKISEPSACGLSFFDDGVKTVDLENPDYTSWYQSGDDTTMSVVATGTGGGAKRTCAETVVTPLGTPTPTLSKDEAALHFPKANARAAAAASSSSPHTMPRMSNKAAGAKGGRRNSFKHRALSPESSIGSHEYSVHSSPGEGFNAGHDHNAFLSEVTVHHPAHTAPPRFIHEESSPQPHSQPSSAPQTQTQVQVTTEDDFYKLPEADATVRRRGSSHTTWSEAAANTIRIHVTDADATDAAVDADATVVAPAASASCSGSPPPLVMSPAPAAPPPPVPTRGAQK